MNIIEEHRVSMDSTIRTHSVVTKALLIDLYAAAHNCIEEKERPVQGIMPSRMVVQNSQHGDVVIGTSTDEKTGIFVQLAKSKDKLLMTIGQKWVIQQPNAQGTLVNRHW